MSNNTPWSETLQQETIKAIDDLRPGRNDKLHFKHKLRGYGWIEFMNLLAGNLIIVNRRGGTESFQTVQELLDAGWVVD